MDNEKKDEKKIIDLRVAKIQVLYIPYPFLFLFFIPRIFNSLFSYATAKLFILSALTVIY